MYLVSYGDDTESEHADYAAVEAELERRFPGGTYRKWVSRLRVTEGPDLDGPTTELYPGAPRTLWIWRRERVNAPRGADDRFAMVITPDQAGSAPPGLDRVVGNHLILPEPDAIYEPHPQCVEIIVTMRQHGVPAELRTAEDGAVFVRTSRPAPGHVLHDAWADGEIPMAALLAAWRAEEDEIAGVAVAN